MPPVSGYIVNETEKVSEFSLPAGFFFGGGGALVLILFSILVNFRGRQSQKNTFYKRAVGQMLTKADEGGWGQSNADHC